MNPCVRSVLLGVLAAIVATTVSAEPRIVAIGDVHGDLGATRSALRLAGVIDDDDRWIGDSTIVVQTGDQLDRGHDEQAILDLFERLRTEAAEAGGAFHPLLGNHELMNAKGDLRYVTDGGFADFEDAVKWKADDPALSDYEPHQRARMAALGPGGPYARMLADRSVVLQLGETVFVHGGVLPAHLDYGIERLNDETRAWLRGDAERPEILDGRDSPQWTRLYSDEADADACEVLGEVLHSLGAKRIVVGHTVQDDGITAVCDDRAWCIDVGLAAAYGGPVEVLEIRGDEVRVLRVEP